MERAGERVNNRTPPRWKEQGKGLIIGHHLGEKSRGKG